MNINTILCIAGAFLCFGMFFGFGASADNQFVLICGVFSLFCAYLCYDSNERIKRMRDDK